jgi:lactoylglutathione lyase
MRIEHIAIWTHDLERLRRFYETYLGGAAGAKYANPAHAFESYFLTFASGPRLELMQMPSIPTAPRDATTQFAGLIHVAFAVGSQTAVVDLTERLRADGYRVLDEPRWTGDGYF